MLSLSVVQKDFLHVVAEGVHDLVGDLVATHLGGVNVQADGEGTPLGDDHEGTTGTGDEVIDGILLLPRKTLGGGNGDRRHVMLSYGVSGNRLFLFPA